MIELSRDEALVFFEYLAGSLEPRNRVERARAEEFVLARIAGGLETIMPVFDANYRSLVDAARDRLVLEADGPEEPPSEEDP